MTISSSGRLQPMLFDLRHVSRRVGLLHGQVTTDLPSPRVGLEGCTPCPSRPLGGQGGKTLHVTGRTPDWLTDFHPGRGNADDDHRALAVGNMSIGPHVRASMTARTEVQPSIS